MFIARCFPVLFVAVNLRGTRRGKHDCGLGIDLGELGWSRILILILVHGVQSGTDGFEPVPLRADARLGVLVLRLGVWNRGLGIKLGLGGGAFGRHGLRSGERLLELIIILGFGGDRGSIYSVFWKPHPLDALTGSASMGRAQMNSASRDSV